MCLLKVEYNNILSQVVAGFEKIRAHIVKKIWIGALSFYIKQLTMNEAQHTETETEQTEETEVMRQNKDRERETWL